MKNVPRDFETIANVLSICELARRANVAPQTVKARIEESSLEPDFVMVSASRRIPLFFESRAHIINELIEAGSPIHL